jgi:hypothetical protein
MNVQTPSLLDLIFNFYGYYVPFILLAIWAPMALIDLAKRKIEPNKGILWSIAIVGLPLIGAGIYHLFGKSELPKWFNYVFVYGGIAILVIMTLLSSVLKY